MKRIIHISLLLIVVLQLVSCGRNQVGIASLKQFDSLVWIAPDSSLHLLENIHPRGSAQRAYYYLGGIREENGQSAEA